MRQPGRLQEPSKAGKNGTFAVCIEMSAILGEIVDWGTPEWLPERRYTKTRETRREHKEQGAVANTQLLEPNTCFSNAKY
jgi:hypothetical protein